MRAVTVAAPARAGWAHGLAPAWLVPLARWTLVAAAIEFLLLRIAIRLGPMLSPQPAVLRAAEGVLWLGTAALNVAAVGAMAALLVAALLTPARPLRVLLVASAALAVARLAAGGDATYLLHAAVTLAALLAAVIATPLPGARRGWLALLWAVNALLAYPVAAASAARLGWHWPALAGAPFAAEGLAVAAALLAAPVFRPRWRRRNVAPALLLTVLLAGFWLARPWLALTLTQWTLGFTGFLPTGLYLAGLFLFTATVGGLERGQRLVAWGLALVALGGLRADYTYLSGLGVLGFLLVAQPWPGAREER